MREIRCAHRHFGHGGYWWDCVKKAGHWGRHCDARGRKWRAK